MLDNLEGNRDTKKKKIFFLRHLAGDFKQTENHVKLELHDLNKW